MDDLHLRPVKTSEIMFDSLLTGPKHPESVGLQVRPSAEACDSIKNCSWIAVLLRNSRLNRFNHCGLHHSETSLANRLAVWFQAWLKETPILNKGKQY